MKKCSKCKKELELKNFYKDKSSKSGLYCQCKNCVDKYQKKNKDKMRLCHLRYIINNKERVQKNNKRYKQSFKGRYLDYRYKAKNRGFLFELTPNQFKKLLSESCFYCGSFNRIGIDRTDSKKGYVLSNCVSCCCICNMMKVDHKAEDFIKYCFAVVKKHSDVIQR